MKFILDANLSWDIAHHLKANTSYEYISILQTNPLLDDEQILKLAVEENAVIITCDKDFGELVFRMKLPHKGILLLRVDELSYETVKQLLLQIIFAHGDSLQNKFAVYQNGRMRIRDAV